MDPDTRSLRGPARGRFSLSTTAAGARMGHTYQNALAAARRAGLDVSGL
jgi:hypothetical protein